MDKAKRERLIAKAVKMYGQGKSIREICDAVGMSYGWTHRVLKDHGVTFRSRGGPMRLKAKRA